ncbi:AraC family transcriptional regulator [Sphingobium yanoikuyae]|uniref:AraC family transcriptional regulator n=1 Tax=Sphingobium yanoikuyae TaxID=13690 RepID=A0A291MXR2_SPHYA|nr:AraC family transcriptional regulator [Sphingobium yanoikuyae]ATI79934.1 AraC family transcriptional regulator [Sphingobium yanoikuyae]
MTRNPDRLTNHPVNLPSPHHLERRLDTLSHLLSWVRLRGEMVYRADLTESHRLRFAPGASHVHLVTQGTVELRPHGEDSVRLHAGDLALLPHGYGHEIAIGAHAQDEAIDAFDPNFFDADRLQMKNGNGPATTRMIGSLFRYERTPLPPVLNALPSVVYLKATHPQTQDWRNAMATFLIAEVENPAPGSALMISRIIDLMVIRTLRSWAGEQPMDLTWLGGEREERLGRVLAVMHEEPARVWTVHALAQIAGMSRSVFADRFARAYGEPPLRYLMRWRFLLAIDLLEQRNLPVSEIAYLVGYQSEAGFSRAFKAFHGVPPSSVREEARISR